MPNTRKNLRELIDQYYIQNFAPTNRKLTDHLIANGVTVQKWIPVTERLPELWQTVIVCDTREQYVGACMYYGNDDWLHDDKLWDTSEITHWMPLPKPPKGE